MPEKSLSTFQAILFSAGAAGVMQFFVLLLLAFKMRPVQYVAAFGVTTISGGALSALGIKWLHMDPLVACSLAALIGATPAVFIPFVVMKVGLKRLGLQESDLSAIMEAVSKVSNTPMPVIAPQPEVPADAQGVQDV